jgi:hypothetical protein
MRGGWRSIGSAGVHPIRLALVAGLVGLAGAVIILGIWWWTKRK